MIPVKAYAAYDAENPLKPYTFERKEVGAHQVQIEISCPGTKG